MNVNVRRTTKGQVKLPCHLEQVQPVSDEHSMNRMFLAWKLVEPGATVLVMLTGSEQLVAVQFTYGSQCVLAVDPEWWGTL
jgi:hypothetical protein